MNREASLRTSWGPRTMTYAAMLTALGILVPFLFHQVGIAGKVFLPMHFPVLIAGMLLGPTAGLAACSSGFPVDPHEREEPMHLLILLRRVCLAACALLLPLATAASALVTIQGEVTDPQGKSVCNATVTLEGTSIGAICDFDGRFRLHRVPEGTYTIRATHIGFAPISLQIEAVAEYIEPVTLRFAKETPVPMDEIVVTGTKTPRVLKDAPLPVVVIDLREIDHRHADTVADVMDHVPGVTLMPNGFTRSSVSIHGLPQEYCLLLVDGQRQYGRHADAVDLETIPTEAIERIELVKGPSSVLYGSDAVAGIINVITRGGLSGPIADLYASGGSKDSYTFRSRLGGPLLGWQHHLAGGWNTSDYMGEGYGFRNLNARLTSQRTLKGAHLLRVKLGYSDEQTEEMPRTEEFPGGHYLDDEVMDGQVGWSWQATGSSRWDGAAYYYDQYRRDARPGGDPREWDRENYRVELQNTTQVGKHALTGGVELRFDHIEYTLIHGRKSQRLSGLFVQDEWEWSNVLTAVLASRVDHHDRWGVIAVPRAGVALRPTESAIVRVSGGTSFRAPSLSDLYEHQYYHPWGGGFWLGGNPDLEPEKSVGANLDVELLGSTATLSVEMFYNRLTNRIAQEDAGEEIDGKPVRKLVNKEEAVSDGLAVQIRWLPRSGLRTRLAYTYLYTEDKATGLVFDYSPEHTVDVGIGWQPSGRGFSLNVDGKYLGERYASASRGRKLSEAYVLNLAFEKRIVSGLSIFATVDNMFAEKLYWESRYFEQGRQYKAGLRYRM